MILSRLFAPRYDVFVSYRSQDVRMARTVADQLIAAGKKVWFAEYQILLKQYERFRPRCAGRMTLVALIRDATGYTAHGLFRA